MSHTPTSSTPAQGNVPSASSASAKPSLAGTRIKQRKGQAKAASKFEPEAFRDALLLHLSLLSSPLTKDAIVAKLVQAGSTLEFLRYSEQLFELLFVGGLLQPGGSYLDDKRSPVYLLQEPEDGASTGPDGWADPISGMVEVLNRVIQRYRYLQKPMDENFLPDLLGYLPKWDAEARKKLAQGVALLVLELGASPKCLQSLAKDVVVKDNVSVHFFTEFARAYLAKQNMEHLSATLRRSGLRDLLALFPLQVRNKKQLEDYFKQEKLPAITEWYAKQAASETKESTSTDISRLVQEDETNEAIIEQCKASQAERKSSDADVTESVWLGLMKSVDWTAKTELIDSAVIQLITTRAPILETFCKGAKAEVGLINSVQVYCYTETRILKTFPQILKVLYNADVISDQAIVYWHQKGAKPQGKAHFLKATEAMVKFLEEQDSDEE